MILDDKFLNVLQIAKSIAFSSGSFHIVLTDILGNENAICKGFMLEHEPKKFNISRTFVTRPRLILIFPPQISNFRWNHVHHYQPESKI